MVNHVIGAVSCKTEPGFQVAVCRSWLPAERRIKPVEKTMKSDAQSMVKRRNDLSVHICLVNDLQISVKAGAPKNIGLVALQVDVDQPVSA